MLPCRVPSMMRQPSLECRTRYSLQSCSSVLRPCFEQSSPYPEPTLMSHGIFFSKIVDNPPPNWVLRTAINPAILTGQLAVRSTGAQHSLYRAPSLQPRRDFCQGFSLDFPTAHAVQRPFPLDSQRTSEYPDRQKPSR